MTTLSFSQLSISLSAAMLLASALTTDASEPPAVTDPVTGETVSIGDLNVEGLTAAQRQEVGDQLAEQGVAPGRQGREPGASADRQGPGREAGGPGDTGAAGRGGPDGPGGQGDRGGPDGPSGGQGTQ